VGGPPLPTRRRALKIGRLPPPRFEQGGSDVVRDIDRACVPEKRHAERAQRAILEKPTQEVPNCMTLRSRNRPLRMGAIRAGTLLPTNSDKRCRNGVAGSPRQIEVYSRTPRSVGPVPLMPEGGRRKSVDFRRLTAQPKGYVVRSSAAKDRFRNRDRPFSVSDRN
jgi:hypothetical protein